MEGFNRYLQPNPGLVNILHFVNFPYGRKPDYQEKTYDLDQRLLKPIFHLATLFARREAKTRNPKRDWLKLAGEKIRRQQVGSVPTFLCARTNKFVK